MSANPPIQDPAIAAVEAPIEAASDKEMNFSKLRKRNDQLERQNRLFEEKLDKIGSSLEQYIREQSAARAPQGPQTIHDTYGLERGGLLENDKLVQVLEAERGRNRKEAEEISRQTISKMQKEQYAERLYDRYPDYAQVVNDESMQMLEAEDEDFLESLRDNPDEYKRRELAYRRIKKLTEKKKAAMSPPVNSQEIVNKNKQANYAFTSSGFGGASKEFNWKEFHSNPAAQKAAYEKLKANQKRGL